MSLTGKGISQVGLEKAFLELVDTENCLKIQQRWRIAYGSVCHQRSQSLPSMIIVYKRFRDLDYIQVNERLAVILIAILQLEVQGECSKSATEAVFMVGYNSEGIYNQEQTRWLSWNKDGGVRGFDLARNPGLSNNTEYGAGEFSLRTRPSAGAAVHSTSRPLSMTRSQQTEEAYPDLNNLKKELERAQRERDKANLDQDGAVPEREQANLERDQAIPERDQANLDLNLIKAERAQAQRLHEKTDNCEQIRSEIKKTQRRPEEFAKQKEKKKTTTEPAVPRSRPESRMEVD